MKDILIAELDSSELFKNISFSTTREEILGEFLHQCLYFLPEYTGSNEEIERAISQALAFAGPKIRFMLEDEEISHILNVLESALVEDEIKRIFSSTYFSLREAEFFKEDGEIIRIDRLNFLEWKSAEVIEYKFRKPNSPSLLYRYKQQVKEYMKVIMGVYHFDTRGIIIYFENKEIDFIDGL